MLEVFDAAAPADDPWQDLAQLALTGDEVATNRLLAEIRPYLKAEVEKRHGNPAPGMTEPSDVVQDCLLNVWQRIAGVHGKTDERLRAWLAKVAKNGFLDAVRYARQGKRDVGHQVPLPRDAAGEVALAAGTSSPSQHAVSSEEKELRTSALSRLAPDDQQVLRLHFSEGRGWSETAGIMNRSEVAVKQLYYRAVRRWKQEMEEMP
jgi:RNA polymerase sigma factor (sigma-70 family)